MFSTFDAVIPLMTIKISGKKRLFLRKINDAARVCVLSGRDKRTVAGSFLNEAALGCCRPDKNVVRSPLNYPMEEGGERGKNKSMDLMAERAQFSSHPTLGPRFVDLF